MLSCHVTNATSVFRDHSSNRARTAHHCLVGLDYGSARLAYLFILTPPAHRAVPALLMTPRVNGVPTRGLARPTDELPFERRLIHDQAPPERSLRSLVPRSVEMTGRSLRLARACWLRPRGRDRGIGLVVGEDDSRRQRTGNDQRRRPPDDRAETVIAIIGTTFPALFVRQQIAVRGN